MALRKRKPLLEKAEVYFSKSASKKLRSLEPAFKKLKDVHEGFIAAKKDDWPYWYQERSQIGFLAAAIWLCGGTALEEYREEKEKGRGAKGKGRCDLWVKVNGAAFCCEAKWVKSHVTVRNSKTSVQKLSEKLKDTERDLRTYAEEGLALCFVSPWIGDKCDRSALRNWIELLRNKANWQGLVWIGLRAEADFPPQLGTDIFYGLLLVVREVGVARDNVPCRRDNRIDLVK